MFACTYSMIDQTSEHQFTLLTTQLTSVLQQSNFSWSVTIRKKTNISLHTINYYYTSSEFILALVVLMTKLSKSISHVYAIICIIKT